MPMVKYWKTTNAVRAKVTTNEDGATIMKMEGEDYTFPGFPRGYLLFGTLSKLKHEIKNQLFNDSWKKLEDKADHQQVINEFKDALDNIEKIVESAKYDMAPPTRMFAPVKEIWRAMETLENESKRVSTIKKAITYILTEDDAYRFRLQWIVQVFNPSAWWFKIFFRDPVKDFDVALQELEVAEVIGDMKERIRLFRRILLLILEDKKILDLFKKLCKELDWNKLKMSEGDKYHFRAKYFKVDLDRFEY